MPIDLLFPKMLELSKKMEWTAEEVIRDEADGPVLYIRIGLIGPHFDELPPEPFVTVGKVSAHRVIIDDDGYKVRGYFDEELPEDAPIRFGYDGLGVYYQFPGDFHSEKVKKLDRKLIPKGVRVF